jgi:hypothetical protein
MNVWPLLALLDDDPVLLPVDPVAEPDPACPERPPDTAPPDVLPLFIFADVSTN